MIFRGVRSWLTQTRHMVESISRHPSLNLPCPYDKAKRWSTSTGTTRQYPVSWHLGWKASRKENAKKGSSTFVISLPYIVLPFFSSIEAAVSLNNWKWLKGVAKVAPPEVLVTVSLIKTIGGISCKHTWNSIQGAGTRIIFYFGVTSSIADASNRDLIMAFIK